MNEAGKSVAKDKKEITSSSLQNPSDPDATYRHKAGKDHKGYAGNIIETVGENGDSLITDMAERARYQAKLTTDEYKQLTRKRSAVEMQ
ncbi:MAG: hypothetical protein R3Y67_09615 [Eubacteriales bacterium]